VQITDAQIIKNDSTLSTMFKTFEKKKQLAKGRSFELFGVLKKDLTADERLALTFLYAYMPLSDLAMYNGQFFLDNVRMSLKSIKEMKWGKMIPEDIFLHFVLPVRVNNEYIDSFRIRFYDEIKARISGMDMKQAALEINHWCHEKVTYRPSDERTSAPLASMCYSWGRCGEESTFTVAALRTAGIPARQVYTPRWAHTDDNHAWVEVWVEGKWYFLGACEPEPDLNMGWFAVPATRTMLVHTRAYGHYNGTESILENKENFAELNLIANYAPAKKIYVKVTDKSGNPVENAKVEYQLYNYAEFYPLAKTFTTSDGLTNLSCGLGDLLIWANKGDNLAYKKISVAVTDTLILVLDNKKLEGITELFDIIPPPEGKPVMESDQVKKVNDRRLRKEDSIRNLYNKTFKDTIWAKDFAIKLKTDTKSTVLFITRSYGNWKEITSFLKKTTKKLRPLALRILAQISDKDLRDIKARILSDHLTSVLKQEKEYNGDKNFFDHYILSPVISSELITPWRSFLQYHFGSKFASNAKKDITLITSWINQNIHIDDDANAHSRALISPIGVYELRLSDKPSRDIFFVALCRSMGIAARLDPGTRIPQYYNGKGWIDNDFEPAAVVSGQKKGFLHFYTSDTVNNPRYYNNFTIAVYRNGVYHTIELEEGKAIKDFPENIELTVGKYMLVSGNRMSDGSVMSSMMFFDIGVGTHISVPVNLRSKQAELKPVAKLYSGDRKMIDAVTEKLIRLSDISKDKAFVIIYLNEKEPSKHVMNDLADVKDQLDALGSSIIFVMPSNISPSVFQPETLKNLPVNHYFVRQAGDDILNGVEVQTNTALSDKLPVIMAFDRGMNLMFLTKGYNIGTGEQLIKVLKKIL